MLLLLKSKLYVSLGSLALLPAPLAWALCPPKRKHRGHSAAVRLTKLQQPAVPQARPGQWHHDFLNVFCMDYLTCSRGLSVWCRPGPIQSVERGTVCVGQVRRSLRDNPRCTAFWTCFATLSLVQAKRLGARHAHIVKVKRCRNTIEEYELTMELGSCDLRDVLDQRPG